MSIQKQCILRYRSEGHVRFQLPAELCHNGISQTVVEKIKAIEGVYRVSFYAKQGKISIHYQEVVCDFTQLIKQLFIVFAEIEKKGLLVIENAKKASFINKISKQADKFAPTRWIKEKTVEAKETLQAAKIITKLGLKKPKTIFKDPEKAIFDFLNDILVLFLVRLHWEHITKLWLINPLKYRYEWLATLYMFFLLIRSRRPKSR